MAAPYHYDNVVKILSKEPHRRWNNELQALEPWFKKKSPLFADCSPDTIHDVIKHLEFRTVDRGYLVVHQGEIGNSFYIILRGRVSVLIQGEADEESNEEKFVIPNDQIIVDQNRPRLGVTVGVIGDGKAFGEQALINDDCVRTASIVSDDLTDLIIVHRDLYNRSLAKVVSKEFDEKLEFLSNNPLFSNWSNKWKKSLAMTMTREVRSYEEPLVKQGDAPDVLYFIVDGQVKVSMEPEDHTAQFKDFMHRSSLMFDDEEKAGITLEYFPLAKWVSPKSRAADRLKKDPDTKDDYVASVYLPEYKLNRSPSDIRKLHAIAKANAPKINICYLESGHIFGDVEFLLQLPCYHATATCSLQTTVYAIHRVLYDRLFKKKNPTTLPDMANNLLLGGRKRYTKNNMLKRVPLLEYINMQIEYICGQRKARRKLKDDGLAVSLLDGDFRPKSKISSMSYPMSRQAQRRYNYKEPGGHFPGIGQRGQGGDRQDSPGGPRFPVNFPKHSSAKTSKDTQAKTDNKAGNPMEGIFEKIMKISNPNISKKDLDMDEEEYQYLLQLKRRLSKQLEDFYPGFTGATSGNSSPRTGTGIGRGQGQGQGQGQRSETRSSFPTLRQSGNKSFTGRQLRPSPQKSNKKDKNVLFSLPRF